MAEGSPSIKCRFCDWEHPRDSEGGGDEAMEILVRHVRHKHFFAATQIIGESQRISARISAEITRSSFT